MSDEQNQVPIQIEPSFMKDGEKTVCKFDVVIRGQLNPSITLDELRQLHSLCEQTIARAASDKSFRSG